MLLAIVLLVLYQKINRRQVKNIDIFAKSIVLWNVWSFMLVEILSCINLLIRPIVLAGWYVFDFVLVILVFYKAKNQTEHFIQELAVRIRRNTGLLLKAEWYYIILLVAGTAAVVLALFIPPYNWDSMTYHLPRIMQWAQNQTVAHYAANDVRQLASPVLAEFINLQVYLCSGKKDILFNMLQTVSYLVDTWFIYEIAKKIGTSKRYAALAAFLFMTMPSAFGEALNTQVDLFATLWLLLFVHYYIDLFEAKAISADKETVSKVVIMALCVSFGYLAKPSVDVGMACLLVLLLVKCFLRHNVWKNMMQLFLAAVPFVLLPLLPELVRNYLTFSSLGNSAVGASQLIGTLRPNYVLVSIIKNFAHNIPNVYLYNSKVMVEKGVALLAMLFRVELNDPSISEGGLEYIMKEPPVYGHDTATNPLVMILAIICFVRCLVRIKKKKNSGNRYTLYSMALFIFFCGIVRWEPYVSRYMLSYLALLCPMIGYQMQEHWAGVKDTAIVYFLGIMSLLSLISFHKEMIPEVGSEREAGYFVKAEGMYPEYAWVFSQIRERGYETIGIKLSSSNFEYPMWQLSGNSILRIENVLVENESAKYEDNAYIPDCIIMDAHRALEEVVVHGQEYNIAEEFRENDRIVVLVKK